MFSRQANEGDYKQIGTKKKNTKESSSDTKKMNTEGNMKLKKVMKSNRKGKYVSII